jgi:hypothetical protein
MEPTRRIDIGASKTSSGTIEATASAFGKPSVRADLNMIAKKDPNTRVA